MSTSIMIHRVNQIRASAVHYHNANSVTLEIQTQDSGSFSVTLFDLSVEDAEHLARSLADGAVHQTESDIRADERRRIAAKLGL